MAEGQAQQQQQQQLRILMQNPVYQGLIRPDQISAVSKLSETDRTRFSAGCRQLWNHIQTKSPDDKNHQQALTKLQALTQHIRKAAQQNGGPPAAQQGAHRPASQGQVVQPQQNGNIPQAQQQQTQQAPQQTQQPSQQTQLTQQQQPQAQQSQAQHSQAQQSQAQQLQNQNQSQQQPIQQMQQQVQNQQAQNQQNYMTVPEHWRMQAENISWLSPANVPDPAAYRDEVKRRYAEALWRRDTAMNVLNKLGHMQKAGKELPANSIAEGQHSNAMLEQTKNFINSVNQTQQQLRLGVQAQSQQAARNANGQAVSNPQGQQQAATPTTQPNSNNNNGRAVPQNAALDAARQQQVNRPPSGSPVTAQPPSANTPTQQQQQNSQNMQQRPQHPFGQSPQTAVPTSAMAQQPQQQPQPQQQQAPQQGQPVPFTHQGAMDAAAKSHQNSNSSAATQPQPQAQAQSQQPMARPDVDRPSASRWPISKEFRPTTPSPVQMGPSRPTMAGPNSSAMGMIGQPALQQPPTYSLHGPGDRVLDKKKLDELVRQVCGAGDGSSQPTLHPEVEDVSIPCNSKPNAPLIIFTVCASARRRILRQCCCPGLPPGQAARRKHA